ncbi:WYL domain-containing protein [Labedella populi]|uniref:WYL domain-containing protein n=2 Tax=Labedella populi TaxID=2498850 RepID=A0A3S4C2U8_9MICO|nr:WYL domain-containing protein [Labedella populi]RWZ61624.1 WYL domain-containing protein [Labedella populi]
MADFHPVQAQDKLAFLLSLVPYLMDHDRVSVSDAARHFRMPPEQIRQAVRLIAVSGVPGETTQYQHDDLFDIDWDAFEQDDEIAITHLVAIDESPRFSAREAAALIAGLQYLSGLPEQADRDVVGALMAKLALGASAAPSEVAVGSGDADATLAVVRESVSTGRSLSFDYLNARGERERRVVDPLRVESLDADWYVRAWDHGRRAVRTFRLDRMSDLAVTDEPASAEARDVILPETLFQASPDDLSVELEVTAAALPLIDEWIGSSETRSTSSEVARVTVRLAHYASLTRLVAGLAGLVTVVEPPEARASVASWASAALDNYTRDGGSPSDPPGSAG